MRFLRQIRLITMFRKCSIVFLLLFLCSCKQEIVEEEKVPLYKLTVGKNEITVGESSFDDEKAFLKQCSEFHTSLINDVLTVSSITLYLDDVRGKIKIDDDDLNRKLGIEKACYLYNGKYIEKNGHVCIVSKQTNDGHLNTISFYSDILNDDVDKIDHIIVEFK